METNTVIDDGSNTVREWLRNGVYEDLGNRVVGWERPECELAQRALNEATIGQLFRLYRYSQEKTDYRFVSYDPTDHLAITFSGMYVAILPDGSTHT